MSMIFVGIGTAHMGVIQRDTEGKVISESPAHWDPDPEGGCVALGILDPDTMDPQEGSVEIFGDWDASSYLARILEILHPNRKINIPNLESMIRVAAKQGMDICEYCQDCNCQGCIVNRWKGESNDE